MKMLFRYGYFDDKKVVIFLLVVFACKFAAAQVNTVTLSNGSIFLIGDKVQLFEDKTGLLTPGNVINASGFTQSTSTVPGLYTLNGTLWIRFTMVNASAVSNFVLNLNYPILDEATLYQFKNGRLINAQTDGFNRAFSKKKYKLQAFVYDLNLLPNDTSTYLLKVNSSVPVSLPLEVGSAGNILHEASKKDIFTALYIGIILSLFLYNIFIYFSVRDRGYIYYVFYILLFGFTQIILQGYGWRWLWPGTPVLNPYSIIIVASLAGLAAIAFARLFLDTRKIFPRLDKVFYLFSLLYVLAIILVIAGKYSVSFRIIDINVSALVLFSFVISILIAKKGNSSGIFFLISWTIFIVAMLIFVLKNAGVFPYTSFTNFVLYIGSSIQAILLSIALANRINIYKKEKENSQAQALKVSQENEQLIREQNVVLEQKVTERTNELRTTNHQLSNTLMELKDAQTQLVDAEKMASLGQLTAGIAHEINNPINFVKSNISPLKLDIKDIFDIVQEYNDLHTVNGDVNAYKIKLQKIEQLQQQLDVEFIKNEITHLIKGIEDGADRTAEIVRGLRTFSRLDESELKIANIHDGIESTIVLIRNNIPFYVQVIKQFNAKGDIECYPGKLNQVFMNIITNGLQAINAKPERSEAEYLTIRTSDIEGDKIEISIKDTGIGMNEEVKHRVFEPFFTTKDVGEGTGLGMAIVFKIIEKHHGKITINSSPGNGAEFILTLPHIQPIT